MKTKRFFAHPTAIIEKGVSIGPQTRIWDNVHIRENSSIGKRCIIGEKTYIAYDVRIGDYVKINAFVYVCAGVAIDDFAMISAGTVFTNDRFPRAGNRALTDLQPSEPTGKTLRTWVGKGATVGAGAVIGPGLSLGEFCMVGMGAVVTRDVPPHALVYGNPARFQSWVCRCGFPLKKNLACPECGRAYKKAGTRRIKPA